MKKSLILLFVLCTVFLHMSALSQTAPVIQLDKAAFMVDSKKTMKINIKNDVASEVVWRSDNEKIATVSQDGVVEGVAPGDAIITASCGGATANCIASVDYQGQNPVLPPTWGLFIADGEPHVFDGKMYIFGSRDVTNGFRPDGERDWCSRDYHTIYSEDMIHWVDAGVTFSMSDIPAEILNRPGRTLPPRRLWAPDLFKSPTEQDKYYLAFCLNGGPMLMAEGSSPVGPFTNCKLITKNGEPISEIDPGILVDDDGKVYLAHPKFFICQLDPTDYSRILPETHRSVLESMPTDNEPFEGPSLRKRGDTYYYIYIQNKGNIAKDGAVPTRMAYMTAKNPLGPYTYQGLIVNTYDYLTAGNVHGSIETFDDQWYLCHHMPVADLSLTRTQHIEKLEFNKDGTIREVIPTSSGVKGCFVVNEKIQSSSGIMFSGGRGDNRMKTRREPTDNAYVFTYVDYPFTFYTEAGQWIGYRYLDFKKSIGNIALSINTESSGGVLEFRKGRADGDLIATIPLPDTQGTWRTVDAPASVKQNGSDAFYIVLKAKPQAGDVKVDWLKFGNR